MLLDADGRRVRRAIGFFREYRRVEDSSPATDISLVGQTLDGEIEEVYEDERTAPVIDACCCRTPSG